MSIILCVLVFIILVSLDNNVLSYLMDSLSDDEVTNLQYWHLVVCEVSV